jgi:2-succinyl-6-hydroxy-2,4-cyclohexadiene-1-carboxylate synthase
MPRLRVNDVMLHVAVQGAGAPLVLLHGFTGSAATWAPHVAIWQHHFRTLAVDLLGHGQSDAPSDADRYRLERCIADLAALLDELHIERAGWLGYSMGARVALAFALAHPHRVHALVLEGGTAGIANVAEARARIVQDEALAARIERNGIEWFVDYWMQLPLFASQARLGPAAQAAACAARRANNPVGLANSLRGMGTGAQESFWERLHTLTVPTLLIVGEEDPKFRAIADTMAARLPQAIIALVPDAGHAAHLENPSAFNDRVLAFLQHSSEADRRDAPLS